MEGAATLALRGEAENIEPGGIVIKRHKLSVFECIY